MDDRHLHRMRRRRSRALVTAASGARDRTVLHDLALPTFARYAARWDWQLLVEDSESGAPSEVLRLRTLRQALEVFELVLWIDPDTILLRDDEDVADHLHPLHFQAIGIEHVPAEHRITPTTGAWLLRSCPEAFAFLDEVESTSLLDALGWDRGDAQQHWARPGAGSAHLAGTGWLPPSWTQPYLDQHAADGRPRALDPHALHFSGLPPADRYRAMAQVVGRPVELRPVGSALILSR